jgi:hypothetical protein
MILSLAYTRVAIPSFRSSVAVRAARCGGLFCLCLLWECELQREGADSARPAWRAFPHTPRYVELGKAERMGCHKSNQGIA